MSAFDHQRHDIEPELAATLEQERAIPAPEFRRRLLGHLIEQNPGYGPRPENLIAVVLGYALAGLVLMALGLLQAGASL